MKSKLYLLTIFGLIFLANFPVVFSQPISDIEYNEGITDYIGTYKISHTEVGNGKWQDPKGFWRPSIKRELSYNKDNNYQEFRQFNMQDSAWQNAMRYSYDYDQKGNLVGQTIQYWSVTDWVNQTKTTNGYSTTNQMIESVNERWRNGEWTKESKTIYEYSKYNLSNDLLSLTRQYWSNDKWVDNIKTSYEYNQYHSLRQILTEKWDGQNWINSQVDITEYDTNARYSNRAVKNWTNHQWNIIYLDSAFYDNTPIGGDFEHTGRLVLRTSYKLYNDSIIPDRQNSYSYNDKGFINSILVAQWGFTDSKWIENTKIDYSTNDRGINLGYDMQAWTGEKWENSWKVIFKYNDQDKLLDFSKIRWLNNEWQCYQRIAYEYEVSGIPENDLSANIKIIGNSPNPFVESTVFEIENSLPQNVELFITDCFGSVVKNYGKMYMNEGKQSFSFNAQNLATGVYFINLKTKAFSATKQMILVK